MKPSEYVQMLKKLTPTGSDYAAAKLLGCSQATLYRYRDDQGAMDNFACIRTAELLDMPLERVIADMELFREKNPERRAVWMDLAGKFAASVILALGILIGSSGEVIAAGRSPTTSERIGGNFILWLVRQMRFGAVLYRTVWESFASIPLLPRIQPVPILPR